MAIISDLLQLLRETGEPLAVPELARLTGANRELVESALEELARLGKLEKVAAGCSQASCPLKTSCGGCPHCGKPAAGLECPSAWRLSEQKTSG